MENFVKINGFDSYLASRGGCIFSKKTNRMLKQTPESSGYSTVSLRNNYGKKTFRVHTIIADMFVPNPHKKETVNHINGDKMDNRACNLEWCTRSENQRHAYRMGLQKPTTPMKGRFGKDNPHSVKVSKYSKNGEFICEYNGLMEAERKTGVAHSSISKVCQGKLKSSGGFVWRYNS